MYDHDGRRMIKYSIFDFFYLQKNTLNKRDHTAYQREMKWNQKKNKNIDSTQSNASIPRTTFLLYSF